MEITFLGHQSWLISSGNTNILIDPVLYNSFGSDDDNSIEIYPPREINLEKMPKIDAIVLSHEHSDHFHIPTLAKFQNAPIIVSPLMVGCALKTIEYHKLNAKIIPFQTIFQIGDLEIILYPSGEETVFWESRVSQVLVRAVSTPENSLFIAVDALVSQQFKDDVDNENLLLPKAIAVSNNSQITPQGVLGSLDNYKNPQTDLLQLTGLSILKELLISYLEGIHQIDHIIICGGGFTKKYDTYFGAFPFSDQARLADIANALSLNKKIFGPKPGQVLVLNEEMDYHPKNVEWVSPRTERHLEIHAAGERFKQNPVKVSIKPVSSEAYLNHDAPIYELNKLAKAFMLSEAGNLAIDFISSQTHHILSYGLMIKFLSIHNHFDITCYALNMNTAEFEPVQNTDINEDEIPFGMELFWNDFLGIISGNIQIWDLGGIAIKSWYIGDKLQSPVAFLYSYYGEQIQSELSFSCFKKRWPISSGIEAPVLEMATQ